MLHSEDVLRIDRLPSDMPPRPKGMRHVLTSWLVSIDADHPQHWEYAKRGKVWDLRTRHAIARGDTVYFWQAGKGLAGRGRVATDVRDSPAAGLPWDDGGTTTYKGRIDFAWLEDYRGASLRWNEVKRLTGLPGGPNTTPRTSDSLIERKLRELFGPDERADASDLPASCEEAMSTLAAPRVESLTNDRRELVLAQIRLRQGQPAFRHALLRAYGGRCAATGSRTSQVLEAAHILPYKGEHTNVIANGMLLRSDIHTLFDRLLLTVVPGTRSRLVTRVAPSIADDEYTRLDGRPLISLPESRDEQPSPSYLAEHAAQCTWLP